MASFEPIDHFGPDEPPRPTTPPIRRGFVLVLLGLSLAASLVYGIPYVAERTGYAYEAGRARAAGEALAKMDEAGIIAKSSSLFRLAAARVGPAVVNIRSFKAGNGNALAGRRLVPVGSGSGVVIDKARGLIVTNYHVIKDGEELIVRPSRGAELPARVLGVDPNTDLAVLEVRASLPVEVAWADPDKVAVGDWVLAIGSPFLLDQSVSAGIISATGRNHLGLLGEGAYEDFLQTDAAVNPGNSGGPLVNLRGEIVGINTALALDGGGPQGGATPGIGLAISSGLARKIVEKLVEKGRVIRGYLGVTLRGLAPGEAQMLKIPGGQGAKIQDVDPGSPADGAGLKPGDVVVKIAGQPVADYAALRNVTMNLPIGRGVPLVYYRDGREVTTEAVIAEMPALRALGLRLRDASPQEPPGVIIDSVLPESPAFRDGLMPGLRVVSVGGKPVKTRAEADLAADRVAPGSGIPMEVRYPNGRTTALELGGGRGPRRAE